MNWWLGACLGAYLPTLAKTSRRDRALRRLPVKTSKRKSWFILVAAIAAIAIPNQVFSQTVAVKSSSGSSGSAPQWTVQVGKVDSGHLDLAQSFQLAIYENLLEELNKTKKFKVVMREGDRKASEIPSLLILKTTVVKY